MHPRAGILKAHIETLTGFSRAREAVSGFSDVNSPDSCNTLSLCPGCILGAALGSGKVSGMPGPRTTEAIRRLQSPGPAGGPMAVTPL